MFFCNCFRVFLTCAVIVCLQVNTDLEPQVASDDSAAELSGLLQDPHFMVYDFQVQKYYQEVSSCSLYSIK